MYIFVAELNAKDVAPTIEKYVKQGYVVSQLGGGFNIGYYVLFVQKSSMG